MMIEEDITAARWCFAAIVVVGCLLAAAFLCWLRDHDIHPFEPILRFLRRPIGEVLVVLVCVVGLVHHGATKGFHGGSRMMAPREMQAELVSVPGSVDVVAGMFSSYTNAVTNVCATGVMPAETSVFLRAHWPWNLYPAPTGIEVYAAPRLSTNAWVGVGTAPVVGSDNSAVIELPYSVLPDGWTSSMFFMLGLDIDTDHDGLSDSFERVISKTDPNLADTDGDGMPDGWEYNNGLNPHSDPTDDEANADADGDGLSNKDEFTFNTNPREIDTDGDRLTDAEEIGRVEELRGDGFLWLDTTGHEDALWSSSGIDSCRTKIPISFGVEINGVCYTNAQIDLDGLVTLLNPACQTASIGSGFPSSGGMSNRLWSADHVTIAAYNTDLYARPRATDWSSAFTYGSATKNGENYSVIEFRNVSHYNLGNSTSARMTFQVILPAKETNVVYVSYLSVDDAIPALDRPQNFGVQLPATNCVPGRGVYANVSWDKHSACFAQPLTLKYTLGTGTNPCAADVDGDGLGDPDEIFVHHTDPYRADTDGDDLDDGREVGLGTDANCADTDGDGMPDGWEYHNGLNPCSDPMDDEANADPDRDGLPNIWEWYNGTDPLNEDTDGDMLVDGLECGWIENGITNIPWFTVHPILTYEPTVDTDRALIGCAMPFTNRLAGCQVDTVLADVNGVVYFGQSDTTNSLSSSDSGLNLSNKQNRFVTTVAAYWTDLKMNPMIRSSIIFGTAAKDMTNRFFVVEYRDVGTYSGSGNSISFQMAFPENEPNLVYVRYGTIVDTRTNYRVSIGAQGAKVDDYANTPLLNYYYQNNPPTIEMGRTVAFHFGAGSDPLKLDTDGDGLDDRVEFSLGTNPRRVDTDGDGFTDREELEYGMNPCSSVGIDGADGDFDGDGLNNRDERIAGTNPSLVDTDGDGLFDSEEVGVVSAESCREWIFLDETEGTDITGLFGDPDSSVVGYSLRNDMRVQGECVTNVIVDLNGVVYFPRCGCGSDIRSSSGRSLDYSVYPDALVVAPYWRDLYITTNAPATKISIFETGVGTNGFFVLQYENACLYSNRNRMSVTNSLSFQVVVERGGSGMVRVVYKDLIGTGMTGQGAYIGYQSLGGLWSHKFSHAQLLTASSGAEGPVVFNFFGQLADGFGLNFFPGFGTNPLVEDTDGDGIPDGREAASGTGPMAPDSDGDGMLDGWEQAHGLDPADPTGDNGADGDPDNDGVPNSEECENNTDPRNSDTDGDGIADGIEIDQGTDPADRADTLPVQWVTVDGDLEEGVPKSESATLSIPAGRTCLVCVFVASDEYPNWTGIASEYNDALYWNIRAEGHSTLTQTVRVNNEDGAWDDAQDFLQDAYGYYPVVLKDVAMYTAGATELPVSVTIRAMNIRDGNLPSSVIVGLFPLNVVQANMPTATGVAETTDSGTSYVRASIPTNGVAYITGQPAVPQLTAKFKGLPSWVDVRWGCTLTTERSERGTLDNRTPEPETLNGDDSYSITEALSNEIVGGSVSLQVTVSGCATVNYPFKIRGKNPTDASAKAYIDANVDAGFQEYAWMIAKHESKSGSRVYNQFNPSGDKRELPNKTDGANRWGWGMCQIDKGQFGDTTAEVYDWHRNVQSMATKLTTALSDARRFVGYYRSAYSANNNWSEPPSTDIDGVAVSAEMWAVLVLYNGANGIPGQTTPTHQRRFQSPLQFVPTSGTWIFHSNTTNPDYVRDVVSHAHLAEDE